MSTLIFRVELEVVLNQTKSQKLAFSVCVTPCSPHHNYPYYVSLFYGEHHRFLLRKKFLITCLTSHACLYLWAINGELECRKDRRQENEIIGLLQVYFS